MILKRIEEIYKVLENITEHGTVEFQFKLRLNRTLMKPYIETLEEVRKATASLLQSFETKKIEVIKRHCELNSDGEPVVQNNQYKIVDMISFNKDLTQLTTEHREEAENYQKKLNELTDLLQKKIELPFEYILVDELPDEIMDMPSEIQSAYFEFVKE